MFSYLTERQRRSTKTLAIQRLDRIPCQRPLDMAESRHESAGPVRRAIAQTAGIRQDGIEPVGARPFLEAGEIVDLALTGEPYPAAGRKR